MRWKILAAAALLLCICLPCHAGDPAFVAGSGYDPGVKGQPLIWAQGNVVYYTDQGDLSPILNNSQADAFVASAFAPWTSLPYVALAATQGGHLAEDVNGSNVSCDPQGTVRCRRISNHRAGDAGRDCLRLRRNRHRRVPGRRRRRCRQLLVQRRLRRTGQLQHGGRHRARAGGDQWRLRGQQLAVAPTFNTDWSAR